MAVVTAEVYLVIAFQLFDRIRCILETFVDQMKLILLQKKVKDFHNTTLDKVYRKQSDFFLKLLQSIGNEKCQIELFYYVNEFGRFSFWSVSQSKLKSNLHTSKWFQVSCIKTLNVFRSLSQIYVSLPKLTEILQNYIKVISLFTGCPPSGLTYHTDLLVSLRQVISFRN